LQPKVGEREIREVVLWCTRTRRQIIQLGAGYETDPPLTGIAWRWLFFCPWFSDQLVEE
jgi:hypothetical protein